MKLPKYNLCYNTRDLIKSLAENANDRNDHKKVILGNHGVALLLLLLVA